MLKRFTYRKPTTFGSDHLSLDEVTTMEGYLNISYRISAYVSLLFSLNVLSVEGGHCVCFQ
jgi:hypothetical protein